jgi:hypothetical protein
MDLGFYSPCVVSVHLQAFKKLRADLGPFSRAVQSMPPPAEPTQQQQEQQRQSGPAGTPPAAAAAGAAGLSTAAAAAAVAGSGGGPLHGSGGFLGGSMGQLLGLGGLGAQHGSALSLSDLFKMDEDSQVRS